LKSGIMSTKKEQTIQSVLKRLLRKTGSRPGGSRLNEYFFGYDRAISDVRKLIREEIKKNG